MWAIRILTGPQAGKVIPVKDGTNVIGRAPHCEVKIHSSSISKEHAKIDILNGKIIITDMNSRNGVFVDGVKINSKSIKEKQKFSLHNIIMDVIRVNVSAQAYMPSTVPNPAPQSGNVAVNYQQQNFPNADASNYLGVAPQMQNQGESAPQSEQVQVPLGAAGMGQFVKKYVDNVVLPGVYALAERIDFKTLLALFIGAFIVFVTLFSAIPLMRILKDSIEQESMERSLTIAKTVAEINKQNIASGNTSALTIQFANGEVGVREAYVVDAIDKGSILAPSNKAGQYAKVDYAYEVITRGQSNGVKKIDDSTIIAVQGIPVYNPQTGSNQNQAYAIIVYDMGQLAVSNNKTISLLVQTLFIALVIGFILFFFMYKVIVYPIVDINKQMDKALNEGTADVASKYDFPQLQSLVSNINSSLSRMGSSMDEQDMGPVEVDRSREMENLVNMVGFPAIGIKLPEQTIQSVNAAFEEKTNHASSDLLHASLDGILDQALRLSIQDLLEKAQANPEDMAVNQLEISGENYEITAQAVHGTNGLAYIIVSLLPPYDGGEY